MAASARLGLHMPMWSAVQYFDSDIPEHPLLKRGAGKSESLFVWEGSTAMFGTEYEKNY